MLHMLKKSTAGRISLSIERDSLTVHREPLVQVLALGQLDRRREVARAQRRLGIPVRA